VKRVYQPTGVDFKVLYDARPGVGTKVVVLGMDGSSLDERFDGWDGTTGRQEMMGQARGRAAELANRLQGGVFVGYDPTLLSGELFEGVL
jgi:hypothetical protein